MKIMFSHLLESLAPFVFLIIATCTLSGIDCYDPLDPNGNITVTFDIHGWQLDGYVARVTIQNFYQYRHVEKPGWNLGWAWTWNEVIWSMYGAFATAQGDCSAFKDRIPHSCKQNPVIADLMPGALPENISDNCCRGGLLSGRAIDLSTSFSTFEMIVGNLAGNSTVYPPANLTLLAPGPGYTCGSLLDTDPTKSSDLGGRREIQVFRTWKSTCTYSSFLASEMPTCCVSLSTFYNSKVTPCPKCSCGCKGAGQNSDRCVREVVQSSDPEIVQCTDHMCPVRVHWHVKSNHMNYWGVKVTISNYNYHRNYSDWNLLVQHPGFSQKATVYSFNNTLLPTVGFSDEIALFWGIPYLNDDLLQVSAETIGSVTTAILLEKDLKTFTFRSGWALPRRVYFSGEECAMPLPDTFPTLPNGSSTTAPPHLHRFLLLLLIHFILQLNA